MLIPVILSGGAGTRLWPLSREGHPKPFMRMPDGQSLLLKTYTRAAECVAPDAPMVTVTNREHYFQSRDIFHNASLKFRKHFILEPEGRNTAAAIAVAAEALQALYGNDAIMLILPADHLIRDHGAFRHAVHHASQLAHAGYLVTFGIVPDAPETGFGYIEGGPALDDAGARQAVRFVEKPDIDTARRYLESGNFLWNSGMFCFQVGTLLAEMAAHAPTISSIARDCARSAITQDIGGISVKELQASTFGSMPDISIDYALMERSSRVACIPGTFDWSDIGSWNALKQLVPADADGNRQQGDAIFVDSKNTYAMSERRLIATVGVDNLLVIDSDDAVLVARSENAQDVKKAVALLKRAGHEAHRLHKTVARPWGSYIVLEEGPGFKIKRIVVKPGAKLSLQLHHHRSEHWIVVEGVARITDDHGQQRLINANESTFIPAGHKHRMENPGVLDLVVIEVQSGNYLGEDDIVRLEDQYGRA